MLNKTTPEEGEDLEAVMFRKYGSRGVQMVNDPNSHLRTSGKKVGIDFLVKRNVYPTLKAHSLMEYSKNEDNKAANQIMEELFHRYFENGENINSIDILLEIASKAGIDGKAAKDAIKDDEFIYAVNEKDTLHKRQMRISGVPFLVIERKDGQRPVGFSGAQPIDIIAEQLKDASEA
jgi:predicted DsbA family dithiol-disulfide isomerase